MAKFEYNKHTGEIRDSEDDELVATVAVKDGQWVCDELNRGGGRDPDQIAVFWHVEDVQQRWCELFEYADMDEARRKCGGDGLPLINTEQCRQVLLLMKKYHDCNFGWSWEVMDVHLQTVYGDLP
jgi:hypothetical protein